MGGPGSRPVADAAGGWQWAIHLGSQSNILHIKYINIGDRPSPAHLTSKKVFVKK